VSVLPCTVRLKPRREKPAALGHPWIFSGAVEEWSARPEPGSVVDVLSHNGTWIAQGLAHPTADLAVRLYTWNRQEPLNLQLLKARLAAAWSLRQMLFAHDKKTNAYRVVFSESDGLSGLIVDRYGEALSVRVAAQGLAPWLPELLRELVRLTGLSEITVIADREGVAREGIDAHAVARLSTTERPCARILENGFAFEVDVAEGQKTGYFLDQRVNRLRVASYARDRSVLSAYCYTGAFEVAAAAAGARAILGVDSSAAALDQARLHHEMNGHACPVEYVNADVPRALRGFRDAARTFDLIILDPPRFVMNASQKEKGLRAYKDINLLALKLLTPGGILATFSCSGLVTPKDLTMVLGWAAQDAARRVRILESLGQPPDHPVLSMFPEAEYLCGLIAHAE
jgi:23S rRNA (cytosine1962-C5)-methyltransferase